MGKPYYGHDMSDDELERLLLDASVAPSEIERCRIAFPEIKMIVELLMSHLAGIIAQKAIDKFLGGNRGS